ncbi:hypothetical protein [Eggerthia catenaformis]
MLEEYKNLSKLDIELYYEWDRVDLEITKEDIIFRVIQESITNSLIQVLNINKGVKTYD